MEEKFLKIAEVEISKIREFEMEEAIRYFASLLEIIFAYGIKTGYSIRDKEVKGET